MILTEEKNYTISLEKEESDSENGLTGNTIELEFSNKELLHEIITCGMPIQRLTVAYPEKNVWKCYIRCLWWKGHWIQREIG